MGGSSVLLMVGFSVVVSLAERFVVVVEGVRGRMVEVVMTMMALAVVARMLVVVMMRESRV